MPTPITTAAAQAPPTADFERKPDPFTDMCISDSSFLSALGERQPCIRCHASRKYFCYTCYLQLPGVTAFPEVELPIQIDIIKHRKEVDGKSTSAHARLLSPQHCEIYHYPDIPDYAAAGPDAGIVLIYPSATASTVASLFSGEQLLETGENFGMPAGFNIGTLLRWRLSERTAHATCEDEEATTPANSARIRYTPDNLPIRRAVFIDSTWNQSRSIYKDERMRRLPAVVLQSRLSQFWRHQKGSPRWYLSTVEAVHQLLLEVHVHAWGLAREYGGLERLELGGAFASGEERERMWRLGDAAGRQVVEAEGTSGENGEEGEAGAMKMRPYCGQYDNLLFLFRHMYGVIHTHYDHNQLKAYKRPIG